MSRLRSVLGYVVILGASVGGLREVAWWYIVPVGALLLLVVGDRGQHRDLVNRFPRLSPAYILALSIGASTLNAAGAVAAAYVLGRVMAWILGTG